MLTLDAFPDPWWPYAFVILAGTLPTDIWRWLGVFLAGKVQDDSEIFIWIRAVATALVAAVIAKLILFPAGALAEISLLLRLMAVASGFAIYWWGWRNILIGVLTAECVLMLGHVVPV